MFCFLPLTNNSITTGLSFFLIKHVINYIVENNQYFFFASGLSSIPQCFYKYYPYYPCFNPVLSPLLTGKWCFVSSGSLAYK